MPSTATVSDARWSKSASGWGSALRVQRNAYAYAVTMVLTGGALVCPACDAPLDFDTAEVDRVIPAVDYRESNIVYLCRGCNQGRSILQSAGQDWSGLAAYASAVADASANVTVPTVRAAREWWANRPTVAASVSRWA